MNIVIPLKVMVSIAEKFASKADPNKIVYKDAVDFLFSSSVKTSSFRVVSSSSALKSRAKSKYAGLKTMRNIKFEMLKCSKEAAIEESINASQTAKPHVLLSLIHICRCRRIERCRSRWSPYH
eukprot:TRINITY_DN5011_c0_g1_i1.p3 TRINITY_DN5011_c0_g1~~TRINITY_DN5011_c0_g1_i1.p3  ORF type:complete len:123 (+),score=35.29 TRINITY_DN5011_c0_g1_i1:202-570(+)